MPVPGDEIGDGSHFSLFVPDFPKSFSPKPLSFQRSVRRAPSPLFSRRRFRTPLGEIFLDVSD